MTQRVRLTRFGGTLIAPDAVSSHEDYWKLIGRTGTVIDDDRKGHLETQVLVPFDDDVSALGLECHNPIENSLWILQSDLEYLNDPS